MSENLHSDVILPVVYQRDLFELTEHCISVVGSPGRARTTPEGPRKGGLLSCRDVLIVPTGRFARKKRWPVTYPIKPRSSHESF